MKTTTFYNFITKQNIAFALLFFIGIFQAQTTPEVLWAKQFGGQNLENPKDIATDNFGNIYLTGTFVDETSFEDTTLTALNGGSASFVAKTDPLGNVLWVKQFGGTSSGGGVRGITIDDVGNVYATGTFTGTAIFDSFTLDAGNSPDIFVVKQDSSGNTLWATHFGGTNISGVQSIVADSQGNVYTTGYFYDNITIGNSTLTSSEQQTKSAFVVKHDTSGNVLWAKKIGQTDFVSIERIIIDATENICVIGLFSGTVDFDGIIFTDSNEERDFFLVKLNPSGQTVWAKQFEVTTSHYDFHSINDISIDGADNIVVTGCFHGTIQAGGIEITSPNPNVRSIFVIKTDSLGNTLWAKGFANSNDSDSLGITTDALGNVYVTGYFYGTVDFDGIVLTYSFLPPSNYRSDIFVLKMNDLGVVEWAVKYGALASDVGESITIDQIGNVLVFGTFGLSVNFGGTILASVASSTDLFLLKLSPNALSTEINNINNINVFPNPVNDFLTLTISDYNDTKLSIEMFNTLGQKIKVFENISNTETLDLSDLTNGIYLLKIEHNQTSQIIKIKKL